MLLMQLLGLLVNKEEIEYWSKNKKECEVYLDAKKYNI